MPEASTYSAFEGPKLLCRGALDQVVSKVKRRLDRSPTAPILIFSDATGKEMDFNFQGSEADVLRRLGTFVSAASAPAASASGPGRPRLGVVSREVSLLPAHWEWLAAQPGGTSSTLRRLVDEAKRKSGGEGDVRRAQERTYRFMAVLAGNLEGYEEALRALYRKDRKSFLLNSKTWPSDVREHAMDLGKPVFGAG
jgi:hypothetical protein